MWSKKVEPSARWKRASVRAGAEPAPTVASAAGRGGQGLLKLRRKLYHFFLCQGVLHIRPVPPPMPNSRSSCSQQSRNESASAVIRVALISRGRGGAKGGETAPALERASSSCIQLITTAVAGPAPGMQLQHTEPVGHLLPRAPKSALHQRSSSKAAAQRREACKRGVRSTGSTLNRRPGR